MTTIARYWKAVVGSLVAGLTALGVALADGNISSVEIVGIVLAVVTTPIGVAIVRNAPPAPPG